MTDITDDLPPFPSNSGEAGLNRPRKRAGRPKKKPSISANTALGRTNTDNVISLLPEKRRLAAERRKNNGQGKGEKRADLTRPDTHLSSVVQHRIVELFACFHTPSQVRALIRDEYGFEPTNNQLAHYDTGRVSCQMSKRLRQYHDEVRERYVTDAKLVAVTHQAHRLRRYEAISDAALHAKDFANAIKALETAAKELGGLADHTVQHKHSGTVGHVHATVEEARQEVAMRLHGIAEKLALLPPDSAPVVGVYDTVEEDSIVDDLTD